MTRDAYQRHQARQTAAEYACEAIRLRSLAMDQVAGFTSSCNAAEVISELAACYSVCAFILWTGSQEPQPRFGDEALQRTSIDDDAQRSNT